MACPDRLRTQAFIDGEIADGEAAAAERHIEGCADCQAFCVDAAGVSDAIRTSASRYTAPAELRRRVREMLEAESARDPTRGLAVFEPRPNRRSFWRGAFSGAASPAWRRGWPFWRCSRRRPPRSSTR
jgi:anti-sigma factor RsiW